MVKPHIPVLMRCGDWAAATNLERVSSGQLVHSAVDTARFGHVSQREILFYRERVDFPLHVWMMQHGFHLGTEHQLSVGQQRVMERLHAEPIAREEKRLARAVPQDKREHATETLNTIRAPRLPTVNDHFGVGARAKGVPQRLQLGNELLIVIDLAVEYDDDGLVLVVERLMSGGEIDDGQSPVAERHAGLEVLAEVVRPAMRLRVVHAPQEPRSGGRVPRVSTIPVMPHTWIA